MRHGSGPALCEEQGWPQQRGRDRRDRHAVQGVDDRWDADGSRGQAPENTGLAAMRVHDLRAQLRYHPLQLPIGRQLVCRGDVAPQVLQIHHPVRATRRALGLASTGRGCNDDLPAVAVEPCAGRQRIVLGPPMVQVGEDVQDDR